MAAAHRPLEVLRGSLTEAGDLPPERQQGLAVHRPLQPPRVNDPPHRNDHGAADDHVEAAVVPETDHDRARGEGAQAAHEVGQAEPPPDNPDDNDRDQSEGSHDPTIGDVGRAGPTNLSVPCAYVQPSICFSIETHGIVTPSGMATSYSSSDRKP